ncbi:hypothetical protein PQQ73_27715 [Paraburkholderia strydomiana]|jgi:ornithine decarboxylase|uniref:Uncharacterized protein n=1 Tax=Paraburkholderia strydomiana TaxID=1245417 RepID=A0ABW9EM15_9BURK
MNSRSAEAPAIPIQFHKLLKIVAIVDGNDRATKELLDHIAAGNIRVEITNSARRDLDEDADVGAYIVRVDTEHVETAPSLR